MKRLFKNLPPALAILLTFALLLPLFATLTGCDGHNHTAHVHGDDCDHGHDHNQAPEQGYGFTSLSMEEEYCKGCALWCGCIECYLEGPCGACPVCDYISDTCEWCGVCYYCVGHNDECWAFSCGNPTCEFCGVCKNCPGCSTCDPNWGNCNNCGACLDCSYYCNVHGWGCEGYIPGECPVCEWDEPPCGHYCAPCNNCGSCCECAGHDMNGCPSYGWISCQNYCGYKVPVSPCQGAHDRDTYSKCSVCGEDCSHGDTVIDYYPGSYCDGTEMNVWDDWESKCEDCGAIVDSGRCDEDTVAACGLCSCPGCVHSGTPTPTPDWYFTFYANQTDANCGYYTYFNSYHCSRCNEWLYDWDFSQSGAQGHSYSDTGCEHDDGDSYCEWVCGHSGISSGACRYCDYCTHIGFSVSTYVQNTHIEYNTEFNHYWATIEYYYCGNSSCGTYLGWDYGESIPEQHDWVWSAPDEWFICAENGCGLYHEHVDGSYYKIGAHTHYLMCMVSNCPEGWYDVPLHSAGCAECIHAVLQGQDQAIYIKVHRAFKITPWHHACVMIFISSSSNLFNSPEFMPYEGRNDIQYTTLGGEAEGNPNYLTSGRNRGSDMNDKAKEMIYLDYNLTIVNNLIAGELFFRTHSALFKWPYELFPNPNSSTVNSNSFVHNLLKAVGLGSFPAPTSDSPGWDANIPKHCYGF